MREDNRRMLRQILRFQSLIHNGIEDSEQYLETYRLTERAENLGRDGLISIAWFGMGASALIGEYIASYLLYASTTNNSIIIDIYRDVPRKHLLRRPYDIYIFYSYSGNTAETLKAFDFIRQQGNIRRNALVITFSTGGQLKILARKEGVPHIKLIERYVSRSHFPYGLSIAFSIIARILGLKQELHELQNAQVEKFIKSLESKDMCQNLKKLAEKLLGKIAIITAEKILEPVARRFIAQFNENAKHFAVYFEVPEGAHNFIVGLRGLNRNKALNIVLRRNSEDEFVGRYLDTILSKIAGIESYELRIPDRKFSWETLLIPTVFADILSVMLADIKNLSAFDIEEIAMIKKEL